MKKEDLIAMGLSEEQANALIGNYGTMIPKERFDEVNNVKKTLEDQVKQHESQLKDLQDKAKGNEDLQAEITKLQEAQKQAKEQYDQQLKDERLSAAVKLALNGKVQDVDIVSGLLDKTKIELDEKGNVKTGLDDQLTTLKESKSFLFVPEKPAEPAKPQFRGFTPPPANENGGQPSAQPTSLASAVASFFSKGE